MRIAAASLLVFAAATPASAEAPEDEGRIVQLGLGLGIGTSYSFAGARLELDIGHVGIFGALGLPLIAPATLVNFPSGHDTDVGFTLDPSFHPNFGGTAGIRYSTERGGCGWLVSVQLSILTYSYLSDGDGAQQSGHFDTLTGVVGYRKRWGPFFAEGGVGLGALLLGNNGSSDDGNFKPYRTSVSPMLDVSLGVGLIL